MGASEGDMGRSCSGVGALTCLLIASENFKCFLFLIRLGGLAMLFGVALSVGYVLDKRAARRYQERDGSKPSL